MRYADKYHVQFGDSNHIAITATRVEGMDMKFHETRRKIIREWIALPKDKRQTEEQVAAFAKKAAEQNELPRSRRDPYQTIVEWLLPRSGRS